MLFADKFEILEAVGRGRVETFVARKVSTDQRVLVYVFEGREQRPDEPTVQWAFESFAALAPSPPEVVIETGRYNATSYAYLVTKLPGHTAMQDWLRSYEAQPEATRQPEVPAGSAPSANVIHAGEHTSPTENPAASGQSTPLPAIDQPEEITKVFEALRAKLRPQIEAEPVPSMEGANAGASGAFMVSSGGAESAPSPSIKRAPGEFTMEFLSGFDDESPAEDHAAAGAAIENHAPSLSTGRLFTYSADGKMLERRQESVTEITGGKSAKSADRSNSAELAHVLPSSSTQPQTRPPHTTSSEIASAKPAVVGAGEFTDFFQGPFNGERPSATPDPSLPVPKSEQTGDFTRMFGRMKEGSPDAGETKAFNRDSSAGAGEGTFTKLFDNPEGPAKDPAVYKSESEMSEEVGGREPRFTGGTDWPSPTPVPATPDSAADKPVPSRPSTSNLLQHAEPSFPSRYEPEGATRVFSGPQSNPQLDISSLPAGPSDYTRIISGGLKPSVPSQEPPAVAGSQNSPSINVSVPRPPSAPQLPQVGAYPNVPASPQAASIVEGGCYHAPTPAEFPIPGAPQPPPVGPTTPKAAGVPWALIIILNVLFILAVALVLYFALKH